MTPAALLARRRRYLTTATARHAPRKIPQALQPTGATLALTAATTTVADDLDAAFRDALADEGLAFQRTDAADGDGGGLPPINRARLMARLQRLAADVVRKRGGFLDATLARVAAQVSSFSKEQFARQVKAAMGVDLTTLEPHLAPAITAFRDGHVALIRSMAADKVARVRTILDDAGLGTRVETIAKQLRDEMGVTRRQAALIARDQVLKLNSAVTKKRHEAAGITEYLWRTSGDASVRPEHRKLEGKRFAYDDPPVVAKNGDRARPGEYFQCRCTMEPIIEGVDKTETTEAAATGASAANELLVLQPRGIHRPTLPLRQPPLPAPESLPA